MKRRFGTLSLVAIASFLCTPPAGAQDLGPGFTKVKDGIYVFAPDATTTTCSFVVTQEGVVMIDSCSSPLDSRNMLAAIKKVTDKPIVFLIDTETHGDHTGQSFHIFAAGDDHQPRGSRESDEKGVQSQARRNTRGEIPRVA